MIDKLFILLQYILPKKLLSRLTGRLAESKIVWLKNLLIAKFVARYAVNLDEAEYSDIENYDNFNDFFTRRLIKGARAINEASDMIVSPCDGVVSQVGAIEYQQLIQAKGSYYTLQQLLAGDKQLCEKFTDGSFITCYLSPRDYHRVHMPVEGSLVQTQYVPGSLFSVNATTAENIPQLFARNERLICEFSTVFGPMALIMVGATIVAGIETVWAGQVAPPPKGIRLQNYQTQTTICLKKGEELGRFKLGSTVILLFPKNSVSFLDAFYTECELRMGDAIAQIQSP